MQSQVPKSAYEILLEQPEWKAKRLSVLKRDKQKCTVCGQTKTEWAFGHYRYWVDMGGEEDVIINADKPIYLHVHHSYYKEFCCPWEYPDDALVTMCDHCHHDFHLNNKVPYYNHEGNEVLIAELTPCSRCKGVGYLPEYRHVQGGICFECNGARFNELKLHR